ncbi:uncharacterized protein LOC143289749 [Babylonia areolata]|uniref:uncharacterized protein LOC143289749 n=1 Tax=Babylonia areolata TaxID=304850 RepID=UPI003FD06237
MEWTVVSCVVFAIFLSIRAEPVVTSSPQEDLTPDPSALNCSGQTVREGAQLMLQCYVKHGDTFIMERANSNLREQLKEGDKLLKEQIEEGLTYEKEERKEGDRRLKEYLDEEVACLREKLARDRRYLRDELEDCERKTNEVEEELGKVRDSVRQCTQLSSAVDDLRQQMSDFQAELKSTQHQLQTTQSQLQTTHNQLQTAEEKLQTTQQQLQTAQEEIRFLKASDVVKEEMLNSTQAGLETTQNQLQTTQEEVGSLMASDVDKEQRLNSTQAGLEKTQNQLQSTQIQLQTTQIQLQTTQQQLQTAQEEIRFLKASDVVKEEMLNSTQAGLETTQNQLQTTQEEVGSLMASDVDKEQRLNSTQAGLEKTQNQLQTTQNQLQSTQNQLQSTQNQLQSTQNQLQSTQNQLQSTQNQLQSTQNQLQSIRNQLQSTQEQIGSLKASDVGSSFVRWGHGQCPSSTSLVYSGVAGGSWYKNTGGGSNFLCLGMTPEMDNTTLPSAFSGVHGAEYQAVPGRDNQDVVCSVCRAPQATTLMIPATRTCPSGWTAQYRGYIMAGLWEQKGRTDFVCVDENREYRQGGGADKNGALFYPVATWCASSLPCPPYVDRKVVTCVVCSV